MSEIGTTGTSAAIALDGVSAGYGETVVLDRVDLTLAAGGTVARAAHIGGRARQHQRMPRRQRHEQPAEQPEHPAPGRPRCRKHDD